MAVKVDIFHLRLSHSGRAVHVAFASEGQEAFLEGHVAAFARRGGVPGRIRYDNLTKAVSRVLTGARPGRDRPVHRAALPRRLEPERVRRPPPPEDTRSNQWH